MGPSHIHVPFSLSDLKQVQQDLGKFSDNPDKYIEVCRELTQVYVLDCVVLLLDQTLASNEKQAITSFHLILR